MSHVQTFNYGRIVACPCCNAPSSSARSKVSSSPRAEDVCFESHGEFLSGYTPHRVFFTYFECAECRAYYCPLYYTAPQLQLLYENQAENMADVPIGSRERTQTGYIGILRRHSRMSGSFLEIGSDIGLFAKACALAGNFDHFWLSEPNRQVHEQIERRFSNHRATILGTMSPAAEVPSGTISTVVIIHALDHMLEPTTLLQDIFNALEPGGVLMVVTHNAQSGLAHLLGRRWPPFTLQHPLLFSPRALRTLLASAGFEVLELVPTINYFPLTFLLRAALKIVGIPAQWVPEHRGLDIGVKLGNICTVARRPVEKEPQV